jgi:tRNA U34 5-methylaminomethyl-2-thiouridine-forming methyltransferase MnmC
MERRILITSDGSQTVSVPELQITYHSIHGAIQESLHVFIEAGLKQLLKQYETINIFEMGFGTGLNALLSLQRALETNQKIFYYAIELFPLQSHEYNLLNYPEQLQDASLQPYFVKMHECEWGNDVQIHPLFTLHKSNKSLLNLSANHLFNLIYFDAFAPKAQPELWTEQVFEKMFRILENKGTLVTYCSKGDVGRALLAAGFTMEKLKGPPHKREMIKATKTI